MSNVIETLLRVAGVADGGGGGGSAVLVDKTITENGEYDPADDSADGYSSVIANVPNTYVAADEGKVVSNGALVAQTSETYTVNGTYDTTLKNSVTVNVSSGPVSVAEKDVNFYDYDGTCVYSYTAAEFANLTEFPANPTHEGLTAKGWNWSFENAKAYVADCGILDLGQDYETADGETKVHIQVRGLRRDPRIGFGLNGTAVIDWGDGSDTTTVTGTNLNTLKQSYHKYQNEGDYTVSIKVTSGKISIRGETSRGSHLVCCSVSSIATKGPLYQNMLVAVEIGENCEIAAAAFAYCERLQTVVLPRTITTLPESFCAGCGILPTIIIPKSVTSIGNSMFYNHYSLKKVVFPDTITTSTASSSAFYNCRSISRVTLPPGIATYPKLFTNCYSLRQAPIPTGITGIESNTFSGPVSLTDIVIPSTVTTIGTNVFAQNAALKRLRFLPQVPPTISSETWQYVPTDCIVEVPYGSLAAYLTATNYPSTSTYTYLGFATYTSGDTLPAQDSTEAYNVTWYATKDDALSGTNAITTGNGSEIYCTYAAVT